METLLRSELAELKTSALQKRARALHVDQDALDEVVDSDDPRRALIDLIMVTVRATDAAAKAAGSQSTPSPATEARLESKPEPEVGPGTSVAREGLAPSATAPPRQRTTGHEKVAQPGSLGQRAIGNSKIVIDTQGRRVPAHLNEVYLLLRAAECGDLETVRATARSPGIRIDASLPSYLLHPGVHRLTALHFAAHNGFAPVVKVLLELRANVESRSSGAHMDTIHWTALHHAAAGGHEECMAVLINAGADRSTKTLGGDTAESLCFKRWPERPELRDALRGTRQLPLPTYQITSESAANETPTRPLLEYSSFSVGVPASVDSTPTSDAQHSSGRSAIAPATESSASAALDVGSMDEVKAEESQYSEHRVGGSERGQITVTPIRDATAAMGDRVGGDQYVPQLGGRHEMQQVTRQERLLLAARASLPAGWEAEVSRRTGALYYINSLTGESTYERPNSAAAHHPSDQPAPVIASSGSGSSVNIAQPVDLVGGGTDGKHKNSGAIDYSTAAAAAQPLPTGWKSEVSRSTGMIYFVNLVTGESTYERPAFESTERSLVDGGKDSEMSSKEVAPTADGTIFIDTTQGRGQQVSRSAADAAHLRALIAEAELDAEENGGAIGYSVIEGWLTEQLVDVLGLEPAQAARVMQTLDMEELLALPPQEVMPVLVEAVSAGVAMQGRLDAGADPKLEGAELALTVALSPNTASVRRYTQPQKQELQLVNVREYEVSEQEIQMKQAASAPALRAAQAVYEGSTPDGILQENSELQRPPEPQLSPASLGSVAHWDAVQGQHLPSSSSTASTVELSEGTPPPHSRDHRDNGASAGEALPDAAPIPLQPWLSSSTSRDGGSAVPSLRLTPATEPEQGLQEPVTPPLNRDHTVGGWSVSSSPNGTSLELVASGKVNSVYTTDDCSTVRSRGGSGSSVEDAAARAMEEAARVMAAATRSLSAVSSTPRGSAAGGSATNRPADIAVVDKAIKYSSTEAAIAKARELQETLPAGWDAAVSRTTGREYYINTLTGESTYDRPLVAARGSPLVTSHHHHDTAPGLVVPHDLHEQQPYGTSSPSGAPGILNKHGSPQRRVNSVRQRRLSWRDQPAA